MRLQEFLRAQVFDFSLLRLGNRDPEDFALHLLCSARALGTQVFFTNASHVQGLQEAFSAAGLAVHVQALQYPAEVTPELLKKAWCLPKAVLLSQVQSSVILADCDVLVRELPQELRPACTHFKFFPADRPNVKLLQLAELREHLLLRGSLQLQAAVRSLDLSKQNALSAGFLALSQPIANELGNLVLQAFIACQDLDLKYEHLVSLEEQLMYAVLKHREVPLQELDHARNVSYPELLRCSARSKLKALHPMGTRKNDVQLLRNGLTEFCPWYEELIPAARSLAKVVHP